MSIASTSPGSSSGPGGQAPATGSAQALAGATLLERLTKPWTLVVMVGLLVGVVAFFRTWFVNQSGHSWGNPDWSHAYFVPFISVYLLWQNRAQIERTRASVYWPGLVPVLLAIWCNVYFLVGGTSNHLGQGLALVLMIFGLSLLLLGPKMMPWIFFPISYLVFAITVPEIVMNYLTYPLQDMAAFGGFLLLRVCGISADLSGNVITIVDSKGVTFPLNVAEQCSGMRTVIAFIALGVAVALVGTQTWWKRVVLVFMAVPVAVALNAVRVGVLGMLSLIDQQLSTGQVHTLIGTLLLIPGFFVYLGLLWSLNKAVPELAVEKPAKLASRVPISKPTKAFWTAFVTSVALLTLSAGALGASISALKIYLRKLPIEADLKCASVPKETDNWVQVGNDQTMSEEVLETLGTRNYVSRNYMLKPGRESSLGYERTKGATPLVLELHLAYYTGMIDTVPHVPDRCNVAGGMSMKGGPWVEPVVLDRGSWIEDLPASSDQRVVLGDSARKVYTARMGPNSAAPGTRVRLPRGIEDLDMRIFGFETAGSTKLYYSGYFFIANGGLTSSAHGVRLLSFDLKSDYAFYLKVQVSSHNVENSAELAKATAALLADILPDVMRCTPDWTQVVRGEYPPDNPRKGKPLEQR